MAGGQTSLGCKHALVTDRQGVYTTYHNAACYSENIFAKNECYDCYRQMGMFSCTAMRRFIRSHKIKKFNLNQIMLQTKR